MAALLLVDQAGMSIVQKLGPAALKFQRKQIPVSRRKSFHELFSTNIRCALIVSL